MNVVRSRGLPALDTPCSRSTAPLCQGVGARPAYAAICRRFSKCRNNPSDQSMAANSGPMPLLARRNGDAVGKMDKTSQPRFGTTLATDRGGFPGRSEKLVPRQVRVGAVTGQSSLLLQGSLLLARTSVTGARCQSRERVILEKKA